jgi:hypothetical protein
MFADIWADIVVAFTGAFAWLGVQITMQDVAKAVILTAFVFAILMILGDIYRGEIQNRFHRILLINTPRSNDREYGRGMQVPQDTISVSLDGVFSNALFYLQYRDCCGKLQRKPLHNYRVKLKVRRARFKESLASQLLNHDHKLPEEEAAAEEEHEPAKAEIVSLAASRADIVRERRKDVFKAELDRYDRLKKYRLLRWIAGANSNTLREPSAEGLVVKFHFPIDPHFMLYKHPDTNIRSTAWLTVLTSVFALFMQMIYG